MRPLRGSIGLGFAVISIAACGDPALRPATPAQTTGSSLQSSHTVDNAGFVDNGGRTSDEYPMGELGGARPTEGGGRPPAASPATAPLPRGSNTESSFAPGTTAPPTGESGAVADEDNERFASAACDRERSCNRIGASRPWKSQDSCNVHFAAMSKKQLGRETCPNGVRESSLAACLKAVRLAPCTGGATALGSITACQSNALCAP